jgi:hypothetical protein
MGNYLAASCDFRHFDFEHLATLKRFIGGGKSGLCRQLAKLKREKQPVVITWGFVPDVQLRLVLLLRSQGFDWVWLDGDREASHRAFMERSTVSEGLYRVQMAKIEQCIDPQMARLRPRVVSPFVDGKFRPKEAIATELIKR